MLMYVVPAVQRGELCAPQVQHHDAPRDAGSGGYAGDHQPGSASNKHFVPPITSRLEATAIASREASAM